MINVIMFSLSLSVAKLHSYTIDQISSNLLQNDLNVFSDPKMMAILIEGLSLKGYSIYNGERNSYTNKWMNE